MINQIFSLSGGKDSTAMILMAIERREPIHSIVFFDTGWEFPQIYHHIDKLEKNIGKKIWRLYPRIPFEYIMLYKPIKAKKGLNKGKIHRFGNGWPSISRRWCTREKMETINYFSKNIKDSVNCIGYAFDEKHRIKNNSKYPVRYPLIEWGINEKDALKYCYSKGYYWDGLYTLFNRVSCYCCPLQKLKELKTLRKYFPDLWNKMLEMDAIQSKHNKGFYGYKTVHDLKKRFEDEDKQFIF